MPADTTPRQPAPLAEPAPAKINLALHVTGRLPNGYHTIDGITVFTELADELIAREAPADRLRLTGPFAAALKGERANLVERAVSAFRTRWPDHVETGLEITLNKMLPVAAGIGGGSADAAAALRLMRRASSKPVAEAELMTLGAELGADIPMCLLSETCRVGGVGEQLERLPDTPACHLVLINPLVPVPTAEVFRHLEKRDNPPLAPFPDGFERLPVFAMYLSDARNDLEPAARQVAPVVSDLLKAMAPLPGCMLSRMSGSGATVFGLFGSSAQAMQAARDLRTRFPDYWVASTPVLRAA